MPLSVYGIVLSRLALNVAGIRQWSVLPNIVKLFADSPWPFPQPIKFLPRWALSFFSELRLPYGFDRVLRFASVQANYG